MINDTALAAIGRRIRAERKRLKINALMAAEAANMSRVTLHRIEHGEPTVAMGLYLSALNTLGLTLGITKNALTTQDMPMPGDPPRQKIETVALNQYPQLRKLAWHINGVTSIPAKDALNLYERNWRHVDKAQMGAEEKILLNTLVETYGNGCLLV